MSKQGDLVLGVIGGGNMGSALVRGLLAGGFSADQIVIVEKDDTRIAELKQEFENVEVTLKMPKCESTTRPSPLPIAS